MKETRLTIEIAPDGSLSVDADGFEGDACVREIDRLLDGLPDLAEVDRKPDVSGPASLRSKRIVRRDQM